MPFALALGILLAAGLPVVADDVFNYSDGADADFLYDQSTGQVWIDPSDTDARQIVSFVFTAPGGELIPVAEDYLPIFGPAEQRVNTPYEIRFTDLALEGSAGVVMLGQILPPRICSSLEGLLTRASYATQLGDERKLDFVNLCPEPAGSLPALVGWMWLLGLARRCMGRKSP